MNEHDALAEGYWQGKVEALQENNRPIVFFSPKFSHAVAKKLTQIAKMFLTFNIVSAKAIHKDTIVAFSTHFE